MSIIWCVVLLGVCVGVCPLPECLDRRSCLGGRIAVALVFFVCESVCFSFVVLYSVMY